MTSIMKSPFVSQSHRECGNLALHYRSESRRRGTETNRAQYPTFYQRQETLWHGKGSGIVYNLLQWCTCATNKMTFGIAPTGAHNASSFTVCACTKPVMRMPCSSTRAARCQARSKRYTQKMDKSTIYNLLN